MKYNQPFGISDPDAPYIPGNASTGTKGSIPPPQALEYPQREILEVITYAGLTPSNSDLQQLRKAIAQMISDAGGGGGGSGAFLPLAGGTMNVGASAECHSGGVWKVDGAAVWHPANDGSGSGLDADLLDGHHASSFVRTDTDQEYTATGKIFFNRDTATGNRARLSMLGRDGHYGGNMIRWYNGDGSMTTGEIEQEIEGRHFHFNAWSDGAHSSFDRQAEIRDNGDIWSRALNAYGIESGQIAAAIQALWQAEFFGSGVTANDYGVGTYIMCLYGVSPSDGGHAGGGTIWVGTWEERLVTTLIGSPPDWSLWRRIL